MVFKNSLNRFLFHIDLQSINAYDHEMYFPKSISIDYTKTELYSPKVDFTIEWYYTKSMVIFTFKKILQCFLLKKNLEHSLSPFSVKLLKFLKRFITISIKAFFICFEMIPPIVTIFKKLWYLWLNFVLYIIIVFLKYWNIAILQYFLVS